MRSVCLNLLPLVVRHKRCNGGGERSKEVVVDDLHDGQDRGGRKLRFVLTNIMNKLPYS